MQPRQIHANTVRHDDPCDSWQAIGTFVRAETERLEAVAQQREQDLRDFCGDDDQFIMTFTRFGG